MKKTEFTSANCPVEVIDVEAAAFKVMLSFIYTGELTELNGDNAMAVLYAAKKYDIPGLVGPSLQIPISELRNVFLAYAQAGLYELEGFANDCLFYIDKNADTLLKSEEFLQIDQKLFNLNNSYLSLIKALRWADSKCRENGIESSAENRRAVLGPALFKIRFPRLSNEEFSKKIFPSDVLSKDEVIAIYLFKSLSNCHGISNGIFPIQFPTNGRICDRKDGTLLMNIEKMSAFVLEKVGSSRYSEKVYINGMPWKILTQIKTKNGSTDNNQKWLGIFFWCDTSKKDSLWHCCVRSATFRIISQKIEAKNSVGTLTISNFVLDNKLTNLGFPNFISFTELMDPSNNFYNREEDKVTLPLMSCGGAKNGENDFRSEQIQRHNFNWN
ncbi:hypothetical protein niasHT_036521 [Heterodera trifolii]|uniref:MATH domain-containing protein n=1 Tax=Heterodera trifolii TaxID=157864 RepID=A0ABD2J1K2_9BILA